MRERTVLKNAALKIIDHYLENPHHLDEAELLACLKINHSDNISEHCLYLHRIIVNNDLTHKNIDSPEIQFLVMEIIKRYKLFTSTSDEALKEELRELEWLYTAKRESAAAEMLELRNIHKDLEHQKNLYLSKCGLFELQIREKHIQIQLYLIAISFKEDNKEKLSDKDLLEKADAELEEQASALEIARRELSAKKGLFIKLQGNPKLKDRLVLDEADYGEILRRKKNYLKRATPFLAVEESQLEKLSSLQRKKLKEFQQAFIEHINDDKNLYDRYLIYSRETSNYELENLLFKAEQLFSSAGIDLPDNIIIYDRASIEEMIEKLEKSIQLFQYEIDQLKERQRSLHEEDEYVKHLRVNNLSDSEILSLHEQYTLKLEELDEQLSDLKDAFRNM